MKILTQIFVSDIGKAKAWYQKNLGVKVVKNYPEYNCAILSIGGVKVDMGQPTANWGFNWKDAKKLLGKQIGIMIEVKDVEKEYKKLKKNGVKFLFKPKRAPWGEKVADFLDVDGNRLRLIGK